MVIPAEPYLIHSARDLRTPALAIYPEIVDHNIDVTVRMLGGDANRWRPHVKTAKLGYIMRRMVERGVRQAKASTTVELATACEAGFDDVVVAYPMVGANRRRLVEIAREQPRTRVSVLVENPEQARAWSGTPIGIFVDVNPGMDRTGIEQDRTGAVLETVRAITAAGLDFRGLHYYDGHVNQADLGERERAAHAGYSRLLELAAAVEGSGFLVREIITSGTPAMPCAARFAGFAGAGFVHRVSPGTVVYNDMTSVTQFPRETGYRPAALVVSTVVSHPRANYLTCDAGHKSVSADAGIPTCSVAGRPDLIPLKPSEEHLPIEVRGSGERPGVGEFLYLIPRHVCPTVNNFDHALMIENGVIVGLERVTARGHEAPIAEAAFAIS
jgi:D-serine deaminase-like pyridoxal phosphate-dependent protein